MNFGEKPFCVCIVADVRRYNCDQTRERRGQRVPDGVPAGHGQRGPPLTKRQWRVIWYGSSCRNGGKRHSVTTPEPNNEPHRSAAAVTHCLSHNLTINSTSVFVVFFVVVVVVVFWLVVFFFVFFALDQTGSSALHGHRLNSASSQSQPNAPPAATNAISLVKLC